MGDQTTLNRLQDELAQIEADGLYKRERQITTPQRVEIETLEGGKVLNFCANNYLGLADNPDVIAAAKEALDDHGFGLASVRFICGTQDLHKQLEKTLAEYFGKDDAILYAACFDANGGLFEPLLGPEDAIISDQLNHASIIDGVRLCKAERYRYPNSDMDALEDILKETQDKRTRMIATDGVFSMDGYVARLDEITALAEKYDALVMVDDCHATGFFGPTGRGSAEHHGVMDKVDIFTSTLGKALGGGMGGFTVASQPVIDMLRQRSRPYLFSNSLAPHLVAASLRVFEMLTESSELRDRVAENTRFFRQAMTDAGFELLPGEHPIVPVMLHDAPLAQKMADELLKEGIYVIGFFYPVVPKGQARIRTQISAAHTREHLEQAVDAFTRVGKRLGVID
ncbi:MULTISPECIES: glycine C-acetyltransferase [unclassified Wenzhouxiangella]|uniref:glycine C-acetyltransferase n=1 Tax=unclassified Wenzhouxiangella TaxID=2613841 RepID=UPI000E32A98B|nr:MULTISPECIES: glycine C-acetyltransferase [unclassified Wenzhouxiangella]RFF28317.1 glycine C-acetyltransferase [Wenzhouxiangella sp. 15181]RFP67758.1 glycine C-acetyltransferase [Wenzhouxiangella sp. 15190]